MRLLDKFADSFPSSTNKNLLKRNVIYSVMPCLFYGRLIDCQCDYDKYTGRHCYQSQIEQCWLQEAQEHLPSHIIEQIMKKFNRFY